MPFIDLDNKEPDLFSFPEAEIVIVGAGAAGILLAVYLSKQGKRILLLESGHYEEDEKKQALNNVQQSGKILNNAVWGRKRVIGGTTIAWGGQSLPFTAIDFEKRDWVQNSGWPISFEELAPYYMEANSFMGIDRFNYSTDIFPKILLKDPGVDASLLDLHISKWAKEPNFYLLYKQILEDKIAVIYNAQVIKIHKSGNNIIDSITVSNFKKKIFTFKIKVLIIASGTIETVRILLNNNLGNHSGWVGKCFMEHPCIEVGTISTNGSYHLQHYFNTHIWKGRKFSIRLSLNSKFQFQNKLLNCSAGIMFQLPKDVFDPYGELKSFKKDFKLTRLIKISTSIASMCKSIWAYIFDRFYYKSMAVAKIALMIEQEPLHESNIAVADDKDEFGNAIAVIHWDISYKTWQTAVACANAIKYQLESLDFGLVNLYEYIKKDTPNPNHYLSDVCHQMGGSKMSSTAQEGVVNKDLQVWGVPNLYVCSCSVFPTSSHSNPTLTMLALAVRLADHLKGCKENQ